jgi:protein gp37
VTTGIEWTDETWNFLRGCSRKSAGCLHCYAEQAAARVNRQFAALGRPQPYEGLVKLVKRERNGKTISEARWTGEVRVVPERLAAPLGWKQPKLVFVNSMSDLFHESVPFEVIAAAYGVMAACPQHTFQILTKREQRRLEFRHWLKAHAQGYDIRWNLPDELLTCAWEACAGNVWGDDEDDNCPFDGIPGPNTFGNQWPPKNVWEGVSVEDQETADERIPVLLKTPAAVRFVSAEPLLGPIDFTLRGAEWARPDPDVEDGSSTSIDWVIAGCESGPDARPCETQWLRSLRDQCAAADVPYFLKQANKAFAPWEVEGPTDNGWRPTKGPITCGTGSKRKPGGVIGLPYLDGVQHTALPARKP